MLLNSLNESLEELRKHGSVKLPSVYTASWRQETYTNCLKQIGAKSYGENLQGNLDFLIHTKIIKILVPALANFAELYLNKSVIQDDIYNVCRVVRPGDSTEGFRGHFDSHLFTLVTPINIPDFGEVKNGGQLHYYPKARKQPNSEIANILGKAFYKRYNSSDGFDKLAAKTLRKTDNFMDYRPLLFLGNTTFHGNSPVEAKSSENRMTILTHFFDPSPKYGVGKILRLLRNR